MIWTFLINALWNVVVWMFDSFGLGSVEWAADSDIIATFSVFIRMVCYFLPMDTVVLILGLIVSFAVFRVVIRLIKTIWELLPFI